MRRLTFFALHGKGIACRVRTMAKKTTKISESKSCPLPPGESQVSYAVDIATNRKSH
jgi:hypothetical protein